MTAADSSRTGNGDLTPEPRIGVFICHCGGNISDVVNVETVAAGLGGIAGVVHVETQTFLCSDPGQASIEEQIHDKRLNRVVVAACSPNLHEATFRSTIERAGLNGYMFEHVNIREHVSWVIEDKGLATSKALRLIEAAINRVKHNIPLFTRFIPVHPSALVIGGGVAGMTAARDLAARGVKVTLVENEPFLGGRMGRLATIYGTETTGRELIAPLIQEVVNHPLIDVLVYTDVVSAEGRVGDFRSRVRVIPRGVNDHLRYPGNAIAACPEETVSEFDYGLAKRKAIHMDYPGAYPPLPAIDWRSCTKCGKCVAAVNGKGIELDGEPEEFEIQSGVIILATGNTPYEPVYGEFGYVNYPEVITLQQLTRMMDPTGPTGGSISRNVKPVGNIAFIHCVGARQVQGVCLPQPDGKLKEHCARTCCSVALHAALQLKREHPQLQVTHFYKDIRTYGRYHEQYYEDASTAGIRFVKYPPQHPPQVVRDVAGDRKLVVRAPDKLTGGIEVDMPADLVVLSTGVGPHDYSIIADLYCCAIGPDDFLLEVHPKLRPVELAVAGVFLAGSCQGPMDITETCSAAAAAASKAAAMIVRGEIELDPYVAQVNEELCTGCQTCQLVCPYEAISMNEERAVAVISEAVCAGCGTCVAACPSNAIQQLGFDDEQILSTVKALLSVDGAEPVVAH